jgi:heat shock protein HtpX
MVGGALAGRAGAVLAFVVAAGMNFFAYWKSDKMVLKHYRARELGPEDGSRLYGTVAELAPRAGLPMPKVYLIPDKAPNAFATGRNPRHAAVAATEGIVDILDEDELAGVMAHELTHVRNRVILTGTIAATFAGAIAILAQVARFGAMGGQQQQRRANPLGLMLIVVAAPLAAMILRMAVSRDLRCSPCSANARTLLRGKARFEPRKRHQRTTRCSSFSSIRHSGLPFSPSP